MAPAPGPYLSLCIPPSSSFLLFFFQKGIFSLLILYRILAPQQNWIIVIFIVSWSSKCFQLANGLDQASSAPGPFYKTNMRLTGASFSKPRRCLSAFLVPFQVCKLVPLILLYLHIIRDLDSLMAPLPFCPDDAAFLSPKFLVSIYLTKQQFSTLSQSILNHLRPKEDEVFLDHVHEEAF